MSVAQLTAEPRERPIPFIAPMVRAVLAGTKTKTRRVVKPVGNDDSFVLQDYGRGWWPYRSDDGESPMKGDNEIPHVCPYGQPGDRLWVREAWRAEKRLDGVKPSELPAEGIIGLEASRKLWPDPERFGKLRPGMFMPRWASRITLEVTGVRVERLQDISDADAEAEGGTPREPSRASGIVIPGQWRLGYRDLWESINGRGSWEANPWVWVVEFKRITP